MKILTKIYLCLSSILLFLVLTIVIVYHQSNLVEFFRHEARLSQRSLVAATDFRAKVRNRLLESYEAILRRDGDSVLKLQKADLDTNVKLNVFSEVLRSTSNIAEADEIFRAYEKINVNLDQVIILIQKKDSEKAKRLMLATRNGDFSNLFIPTITSFIEKQEKRNTQNGNTLDEALRRLKRTLLFFGTFGFILAFFLGTLLSKTISRRLIALEKATFEVSQGHFDIDLPEIGSDELSSLSKAFNAMSRTLKQVQAQLALQQQQLMNSSKLSALGEMAGGIAHEINTPLAVIRMRSEQLEEAVVDDEFEKYFFIEALQSINQTVIRIAKIVSGLRSFSRDGAGDPFKRVPVTELIRDTFAFCQEKLLNHDIQIEVILDPTLPKTFELECRATEVSQVLLNLLNNAYDAILPLPEKWIRINVSDRDSHLEISVTDSGKGIPKDLQDKIMQPFFTSKEIGVGTGLGLSISRGIIAKHQGTLCVDDTSPNTRFVILVPKEQATLNGAAA